MPITTVFFDAGGVLLSNGWDHNCRARAAQHFQLDGADFERRHNAIVERFETRRMSLEQYLRQTVFYTQRPFTPADFQQFMFAQSQALPESLALLDELVAAKRCLLGLLNNESAELNQYRIDTFDLKKRLSVFCSSCYIGLRKPDEEVYLRSMLIVQRRASECVFVDDRPENIEGAKRAGMHTIHFEDAAQLRSALQDLGVR